MREGPAQVQMGKMDSKASVKISKDGLEIESTGNNVENFKANVKVRGGKWYFEVKLLSYGKIHIGWCTDKCDIQTNTYTGIGNDDQSWAYDGSCQKAWHGANQTSNDRYGEYWNNGDIIGTVLDLEAKTISFYRNGKDLGVAFQNVSSADGFYPAIALQKKQKVALNFGRDPFKYPLNEIFPDIHPLHLNLSKSQQDELEKLFEKYKAAGVSMSESGETSDLIQGNGILQYSQDMGIDDKDPLLMVIAWKLNSNHGKAWEFTRDEFVGGWAIQGCHNLASMKKKCAQWRDELKQSNKFKQFYNFVFDYLREDKKIIAMEEAMTVWDMMGVNEERWALMPKWLDFCKEKKAMSRDTWRLFLNFMEQYPKDLSSYDADGCWPSMIDEFVDFVTAKKDPKEGKKEKK